MVCSECHYQAAENVPEGNYNLGDFPVIVKDGTARLLDESHSLAGSILRLCEGLKNVFDWGIATAEEAVRMASEQPARSCGIDDVCGYIRPGYNADFIILSKDLVLEETYLGGRSSSATLRWSPASEAVAHARCGSRRH